MKYTVNFNCVRRGEELLKICTNIVRNIAVIQANQDD